MANLILVPTDGSAEAERAFDIAIPLARALDASLLLYWAWEGLVALDRVLGSEEEAEAFAQREMADRERVLREIGEQRCSPAGVGFEVRSGHGHPAELILDLADEVDARMVAMSTHGRSGFVRWRLGSVADKVARGLRRPTVLFRPQLDIELRPEIQRIVLPLDGSELAEKAVAEAAAIAGPAGAEVVLLRAVTPLTPMTPLGLDAAYDQANTHALDAARMYLNSRSRQLEGVEVLTQVELADPRSLIIEAAQEADLIVMASHGRGGVVRFALGSVTDSVVRSAGRPVLVVPGGD